MTGILERIEEKLDALLARPIGVAGAAAPDPMAFPAAVVADPPATAEMITALVQPHVGDPARKAALFQQMTEMGIGALPEARPDQYAELHARFKRVVDSFTNAPAATVAPSSII